MAYETTATVDPSMYTEMIAGKTAALMACATYGGALLAVGSGGGGAAQVAAGYGEFGRELGLCFQVRDDILGIWGSEAATGKSSGGDIRRRKKSLPFVLAVSAAAGVARDRLLSSTPCRPSSTPSRRTRFGGSSKLARSGRSASGSLSSTRIDRSRRSLRPSPTSRIRSRPRFARWPSHSRPAAVDGKTTDDFTQCP